MNAAINTTTRTHTTVTTALAATPTAPSTASNANAAVVHITVSQPTNPNQETRVGAQLPRTPNTARDRVSPGAPPSFPAVLSRPSSRNAPPAPITATTSACTTLRPVKETSAAPRVM